MSIKELAITLDTVLSNQKDTNVTLTEREVILCHMLKGLSINTDQASSKFGIKCLQSVIPKIEGSIKVCRIKVTRPHPRTKIFRQIKNYWIDKYDIRSYLSIDERSELEKRQLSANIAKRRGKDNKVLLQMCGYCKRETMLAKLNEIYGQKSANDCS